MEKGSAVKVIKLDLPFTQFSRMGLAYAKMAFLIVCLGYHLKKCHKDQLRPEKENKRRASSTKHVTRH